MEINRPRFVIGEREAAEIANYCKIATANKSLLTLSELIELTSIEATEEDLEGAWYQATALSSRYLLDSGTSGREAIRRVSLATRSSGSRGTERGH